MPEGAYTARLMRTVPGVGVLVAALLPVVLLVLRVPAAEPTQVTSRRTARLPAVTFDCVFSASAGVVWTGAAPRVERTDTRLEVRITNVDLAGGTADLMYGAVTTHATVIVTGPVISVVQPPDSGSIVLASIDLTGRGPSFPATYSRTEYYAYSGPGFVSSPQATQSYGACIRQLP